MMTCREARRALLEAEPGELEAEGGSPLSAHLGRCGACRIRARSILAGTDRLGWALDRWAGTGGEAAPEDDLEAARRALQEARRGDRPSSSGGAVSASGRQDSADGGPGAARRLRRWLPPLVAAAAVVGLLVLAEPPSPPGGWEPPGAIGASAEEPPPVVDPGTSGTVGVFETSDPDITVVWFFEREGS